jgi:dTDP-4-dehydrorhamnose reductase
MKILVTGSNGQVGHEIALLGRDSSHEIVPLDRQRLDITDPEAVNDIFHDIRPELVINPAAYTAVDRAESEPELAFSINRDGAANLANACLQQEIPLLHVSTDYVFDGSKPSPYDESDPVAPLGVYGQSKWEGEEVVRSTLTKHIILRTSWVFGSHGNNFVKTMLRLGKERDQLKVVDDQYGGPTSAAGIAAALMGVVNHISDNRDIPWGTYHFSGQPFTNWHGFAEQIIQLANNAGIIDHDVEVLAISSSEYPTPVKRPANSRLSSEKFEKAFKIHPDDWPLRLRKVIDSVACSS